MSVRQFLAIFTNGYHAQGRAEKIEAGNANSSTQQFLNEFRKWEMRGSRLAGLL